MIVLFSRWSPNIAELSILIMSYMYTVTRKTTKRLGPFSSNLQFILTIHAWLKMLTIRNVLIYSYKHFILLNVLLIYDYVGVHVLV